MASFWIHELLDIHERLEVVSSNEEIAALPPAELKQMVMRPYRFEREFLQGDLQNHPPSLLQTTYDFPDAPAQRPKECKTVILVPGGRWMLCGTTGQKDADGTNFAALMVYDLRDPTDGKLTVAAWKVWTQYGLLCVDAQDFFAITATRDPQDSQVILIFVRLRYGRSDDQ